LLRTYQRLAHCAVGSGSRKRDLTLVGDDERKIDAVSGVRGKGAERLPMDSARRIVPPQVCIVPSQQISVQQVLDKV